MGVYTAVRVFHQDALCKFLLNDLNIFGFSEVCREMDSDNISAPCFSLAGLVLVLLSAALNRHQASRRRLRQSFL